MANSSASRAHTSADHTSADSPLMVPECSNQQPPTYNRKRRHSEETASDSSPVHGAQTNIFDRSDTPTSALFVPDDLPLPKRARRPNLNHLRASTMAAQYSAFAGPSITPRIDQTSDVADSIEETPGPDGQPLYMSKAHDMKVKFQYYLKSLFQGSQDQVESWFPAIHARRRSAQAYARARPRESSDYAPQGR